MVRSAQAAVYDEYLESNLRIVLEALVEALLVERPDNVEKFSLEFLVQWHKDHDPAQEEVQRLRAERDAVLRRREAVQKEIEELGPSDEEDDDSELAEEPSPDDPDEIEERLKIRRLSQDRRAGVFSQSIDSKTIADYRKPVYEKSAEDEESIKATLTGTNHMQIICGHLDEEPIQDVVNAFYTKEFLPGTSIITQGDVGECLYIVKKGSVDVFVARPGPDGRVLEGDRGSQVVSLGEGALFGELALLYSAPRAATVMATTETVVAWVLDAMDFKMLLAQSGQAQYEKYEGWLAGVDLLKPLNHFELARLAETMESDVFEADEDIIKQGDEGDCFFILEDGTAAAFMTDANLPFGEKEVKQYGKGDYFGEIALLSNVPRAATVRATGEGCQVVKLSMEDFTALLGPLSESLRENAAQYPHYTEFLSEDEVERVRKDNPEEND